MLKFLNRLGDYLICFCSGLQGCQHLLALFDNKIGPFSANYKKIQNIISTYIRSIIFIKKKYKFKVDHI